MRTTTRTTLKTASRGWSSAPRPKASTSRTSVTRHRLSRRLTGPPILPTSLSSSERRLRYTGKIDDNWQDPTAVARHYLREALDALLQGAAPADAKTHAIGCTIKWAH